MDISELQRIPVGKIRFGPKTRLAPSSQNSRELPRMAPVRRNTDVRMSGGDALMDCAATIRIPVGAARAGARDALPPPRASRGTEVSPPGLLAESESRYVPTNFANAKLLVMVPRRRMAHTVVDASDDYIEYDDLFGLYLTMLLDGRTERLILIYGPTNKLHVPLLIGGLLVGVFVMRFQEPIVESAEQGLLMGASAFKILLLVAGAGVLIHLAMLANNNSTAPRGYSDTISADLLYEPSVRTDSYADTSLQAEREYTRKRLEAVSRAAASSTSPQQEPILRELKRKLEQKADVMRQLADGTTNAPASPDPAARHVFPAGYDMLPRREYAADNSGYQVPLRKNTDHYTYKTGLGDEAPHRRETAPRTRPRSAEMARPLEFNAPKAMEYVQQTQQQRAAELRAAAEHERRERAQKGLIRLDFGRKRSNLDGGALLLGELALA